MAERPKYPSDRQDQFMIRLPDGMRDRIRKAAERNNRSMNAEIVATLEEKYPRPKHHPILLILDKLDELTKITNEEEREQAILKANQELEIDWPGVYFEKSQAQSGRNAVQLRFADNQEFTRAMSVFFEHFKRDRR